MSNLQPLNLTFGIELEFFCVWRPGSFLDAQDQHITAAPALYDLFRSLGIMATGWAYGTDSGESDDDGPKYTHWNIDGDSTIYLLDEEHSKMPFGWQNEAIELISPKFSFAQDDWKREIRVVLDALRRFEDKYQVRCVTNCSTGFHVHVGNADEGIPLDTAKNIFKVATAFERLIDELHPSHRTGVLDDHNACYPPSMFHRVNAGGRDIPLLQRLRDIDAIATHAALRDYFRVNVGSVFLTAATGHNSAYNFDNLWSPDPYASVTGTVEFRQHTGTLDLDEILDWIAIACNWVRDAHHPSRVSQLLPMSLNPDFELPDLLRWWCWEDETAGRIAQRDERIPGPERGERDRRVSALVPLLEAIDRDKVRRGLRIAKKNTIYTKLKQGAYGFDEDFANLVGARESRSWQEWFG